MEHRLLWISLVTKLLVWLCIARMYFVGYSTHICMILLTGRVDGVCILNAHSKGSSSILYGFDSFWTVIFIREVGRNLLNKFVHLLHYLIQKYLLSKLSIK